MVFVHMRPLLLIAMIFMMSGCGLHFHTKKPPPHRAGTHHYVKKGETLYEISRKHHVSLSLLMKINHISDPRKLRIGQKLIMPGAPLEASIDSFSQRPPYPPSGTFIWPIESPSISSSFGRRFFFDKHKGIDLRAPKGSPIYAAADGAVLFAGRKPQYGKMITISHDNGVITRYAHNHKNYVREGQRVACGEQIATVGDTGNASGYHLHFEVIVDGRAVDPEDYLPR